MTIECLINKATALIGRLRSSFARTQIPSLRCFCSCSRPVLAALAPCIFIYETLNRRSKTWRERAFAYLVYSAVSAILLLILVLVGQLLWNGASVLSLDFLASEPEKSGRAGGIAPILVATGWILLVSLLAALPVGLGTAIFLAEFCPHETVFGRFVRRSLDVLSGVPSIVFGLFGNALFSKILGLGFSILSGGLTLACMMLPLLIRTTEEGFRAVPFSYRSGAAALGLRRWTTLWHLLLPAAIPGLVVGLVLGMGRALAETAALIFTSGYVDRMPTSMLDSGRALSIHIYDLSMNVPGGDRMAYASSVCLIALLFLVNSSAVMLAKHWQQGRMHELR